MQLAWGGTYLLQQYNNDYYNNFATFNNGGILFYRIKLNFALFTDKFMLGCQSIFIIVFSVLASVSANQ